MILDEFIRKYLPKLTRNDTLQKHRKYIIEQYAILQKSYYFYVFLGILSIFMCFLCIYINFDVFMWFFKFLYVYVNVFLYNL